MPDPTGTPSTTDQDFLAAYLADRDETCPLCDYNLRGLTGRHCPECGKALVIRVGLEEPNLATFVFGVAALASALGCSLLMLVFFIVVSLAVRLGAPFAYFLVCFAGTIVSGIALLVWLRSARRLRRLDRSRRILLAALSLLVPLVVLSCFIWVGIYER